MRLKPNMRHSNHHHNFLQQSAENYEDSEESEVSSQGTESSQEETEDLEPESRGHAFLMKPRNAMRPSSTL